MNDSKDGSNAHGKIHDERFAPAAASRQVHG